MSLPLQNYFDQVLMRSKKSEKHIIEFFIQTKDDGLPGD